MCCSVDLSTWLLLQSLLVYASAVFTNMGNYKSFGDTKFIPELDKVQQHSGSLTSSHLHDSPPSLLPTHSQDKFHAVLLASALNRTKPGLVERLWGACGDAMYSLTQKERQLGLGEEVS